MACAEGSDFPFTYGSLIEWAGDYSTKEAIDELIEEGTLCTAGTEADWEAAKLEGKAHRARQARNTQARARRLRLKEAAQLVPAT